MTVTEKHTASGQYRNEYKIVEVLEFLPAAKQMTLMKFFDEAEANLPWNVCLADVINRQPNADLDAPANVRFWG
jgi:hypothetical protein